jgi:two-component system chemotaxis sensor kinase CheA
MQTKDFSGIRNRGPLPDPGQVEIPPDIGDLLSDYIESTESMLERLERAALAYEAGENRPDNAGVIRRILHKIKGESGMVGVDDMSEFCHQAEDAFEQLPENERADMVLRFKDWASAAVHNMTD